MGRKELVCNVQQQPNPYPGQMPSGLEVPATLLAVADEVIE